LSILYIFCLLCTSSCLASKQQQTKFPIRTAELLSCSGHLVFSEIWMTYVFLTGWLILPSCPLRQYHFVNEPLTWNEAQSYCRETYTDLATTESMTELNQLIDTVSSSGHKSEVWIGLYTEIDWRWSDGFTGSGAEYRKWGYGEPDSLFAREFCVFISSTAQWYDAYCPSDRSVVCYKGKDITHIQYKKYNPVQHQVNIK
uniref:C-type lectin domain-containing protein n=1 Tax=Stegastes partitus TaxID=144197 RepID=A0A3B4Z377_9TELE